MKWLITGGCGFIGKSLIRDLVEVGGHTIRVIDNLSVGTADDLAGVCHFARRPATEINSMKELPIPSVELVEGDILDADLALTAAAGADVIVHLAASTGVPKSVENPRQDCITNVLGTFNYLEAARHAEVKRFVFASSGAPIGDCEPPIHEEMACHPVSPYGAGKLACEGYCSAYFRTFGVETVALRFGNVYGPGSSHKTSVVSKFIRQALQGQQLEIYGDGSQTRDFIYIGDLLSSIRLAATKPGVGGELFQIATNRETSVAELTDALIGAMAAEGIDSIKVIYGAERTGDVKRNFSDTSKAAEQLTWHAGVPLEDGLKKTVVWFLRNSGLKPPSEMSFMSNRRQA